MLGAVASYRRGGPRPPRKPRRVEYECSAGYHHFIKTLGLLRQLGEIDEVVPLLRHDQTSRSPSKSPARRTVAKRRGLLC